MVTVEILWKYFSLYIHDVISNVFYHCAPYANNESMHYKPLKAVLAKTRTNDRPTLPSYLGSKANGIVKVKNKYREPTDVAE